MRDADSYTTPTMTDRNADTATVFAVVSGTSGAGTTATAVDLAGALADRGEAVVVVDCDFDGPGLAGHLGLDPEVGLADALVGDTAVEETVVETHGVGVVATDAPLGWVSPDLLGEVVADLRERFDVVLLDTSADRWTAAFPLSVADATVVVTTSADSSLAAERRTRRFADRLDRPAVAAVVAHADSEIDDEPAVTDGEPPVVVVPSDDALEASREAGRPVVAAAPDSEAAAAYRDVADALDAAADTDEETADIEALAPDEEGTDPEFVWQDDRAAADGPDSPTGDEFVWIDDPEADERTVASGDESTDAGATDATAGTTDAIAGTTDAIAGTTDDSDSATDRAAETDATADEALDAPPEERPTHLEPRVPYARGGRLSALREFVVGEPRSPERSPRVAYDPERGLSVSRPVAVAAVVAVQLLLAGLVIFDPPIALVRPVLGAVCCLFVPGFLVSLLLDLDRRPFPRLLVYSVGLSAVALLVVGAVVSLAYPAAGLAKPVTERTVAVTLTAAVFALSAAVLARDEERRVKIPIQGTFAPAPLALSLLPFASIFGITLQNATGNNGLLLALLVILAALPLLNAAGKLPRRWLPLAIWAIALALLYHTSLFGPSIGGPSGTSHTLETGRWSPDEESVLPNGVLFPTYVLLTGLRLGVATSVVNPLLVSFLPVILYEGYREQVGDRAGFASACLFVFSFPFYVLYPSAGRVATPVFFLALLGLAVGDDVPLLCKRLLVLAFGMGLGVSHYGTAYVALVAFEVAFVTYALLAVVDLLRSPLGRGGIFEAVSPSSLKRAVAHRSPDLLSGSFVAFYAVFVVEWYFYTSGGDKFAVLPRKVIGVVNRFFEASASGTAGAAVSKQYGSTSVAISRQVYILVGALMGIGLAATGIARLFRRDAVEIDDEFLALAVGFMSMLGASFFVVGFNVARIMMIVFTFTAVFAVYGLGSLVESVRTAHRVLSRVVARDLRGALGGVVRVDFERAFGGFRTELTALSAVLCVFLLLNAGVVTVLFTHDYAPSNIVTQQTLKDSEEVQVQLKAKGCINCNIESHAWLFAHRNRTNHAYGDFKAWAQVDFYRGALAGRLSYYPKKIVYREMWAATNGTDGQTMLLVLDHNTRTDVMLVESMYYWKDMAYLAPVQNRSHRVYTTGQTAIYRSTDRATEEAFDFKRPDPTNVTSVEQLRELMGRANATELPTGHGPRVRPGGDVEIEVTPGDGTVDAPAGTPGDDGTDIATDDETDIAEETTGSDDVRIAGGENGTGNESDGTGVGESVVGESVVGDSSDGNASVVTGGANGTGDSNVTDGANASGDANATGESNATSNVTSDDATNAAEVVPTALLGVMQVAAAQPTYPTSLRAADRLHLTLTNDRGFRAVAPVVSTIARANRFFAVRRPSEFRAKGRDVAYR